MSPLTKPRTMWLWYNTRSGYYARQKQATQNPTHVRNIAMLPCLLCFVACGKLFPVVSSFPIHQKSWIYRSGTRSAGLHLGCVLVAFSVQERPLPGILRRSYLSSFVYQTCIIHHIYKTSARRQPRLTFANLTRLAFKNDNDSVFSRSFVL
ncbi:hypothetical protein B0T20DRAFT_82340 [Sordaria brevicollis]|uniref:Uncharacterized protein n=1 Tax=Sordaria brevicollis TaxID=83679 RepID=A0AAE0P206_SORBR|nr:hypothetical protein B0T20DRAFT_82340 [Sordaria brevicollis]